MITTSSCASSSHPFRSHVTVYFHDDLVDHLDSDRQGKSGRARQQQADQRSRQPNAAHQPWRAAVGAGADRPAAAGKVRFDHRRRGTAVRSQRTPQIPAAPPSQSIAAGAGSGHSWRRACAKASATVASPGRCTQTSTTPATDRARPGNASPRLQARGCCARATKACTIDVAVPSSSGSNSAAFNGFENSNCSCSSMRQPLLPTGVESPQALRANAAARTPAPCGFRPCGLRWLRVVSCVLSGPRCTFSRATTSRR